VQVSASKNTEQAVLLGWIGTICIDQSDEVEKLDQISQMDLVYANAHITIVAAAGKDANYGLPGVGGTLRKHQPHLNFDCYSILSTLPNPVQLIRHSKWATRGWTYQECLLLKRRLIFTDDQVHFECSGLSCLEVLALPIVLGAFKYKTPGGNANDLSRYLSEYSERQLSNPGDAIHAFQGVLNAFSRNKSPVHNFMGILIHQYRLDGTDRSRHAYRSSAHSFLSSLTWIHEGLAKRVSIFPSWSWAGWSGKLSAATNGNWAGSALEQIYERLKLPTNHDASVWIENEDSTLSSFPGWQSLPDFLLQRSHCKNRFIHIEADTIEISPIRLAGTFIRI
jgi:hypothetical protein